MNVLGNTTSLDGLLVTAAIVVLALSAAWLAVIWLAVLVEAASHGRRAPARFTGAPPALRRLLLPAACALLAILGVGGPATARPDVPATPVGATLDGLPMPVPPLGGVRDPG